MSRKRIEGAFLIFFTFWALFLVWANRSDNKTRVIFCDVGQGDGILVQTGRQQAVVDGGPAAEGMTDCLSRHMPFGDRQIELMIATHADGDHLTGLTGVLKDYEVERVMINGEGKESGVFWEFYRQLAQEEAEIYGPSVNDIVKLGEMELQVLWPRTEVGTEDFWALGQEVARAKVLGAKTEINEMSVVVLARRGGFEALLTGDISQGAEKELAVGSVEVLKVAHHGSRFSTGESFLAANQPQLAVISVGKNSFGHPTEEVLGRLKAVGAEIVRTDRRGEIEVVTDGKTWSWRTAKQEE